MATNDFTKICEQRRLQMLFTTPPVRFTPNNPYVEFPQFSKEQFDMRRKAEILKYKNPSGSTTLTKKQKMALLLSGKGQTASYNDIVLKQKVTNPDKSISYNTIIVKYPDYYSSTYDASQGTIYTIIPNGRLCQKDQLIQTPTSSSGIPGRIMNLVYDTTVPLYNYKDRRDYGLLNNETKNTKWKFLSRTNTTLQNLIETRIMLLSIQDAIDSPTYTMTIEIPIAMYVKATNNMIMYDDTTSIMKNFTISPVLSISVADISIYYKDTVIVPASNITPSYFINDKPITSSMTSIILDTANNSSFSFDVSYNANYQAVYNMGVFRITNLNLYTQPGYIYDIHLAPNIIIPSIQNVSYLSNFSKTQCGLYANYSPSLEVSTFGATIRTNVYPVLLENINVTGYSSS